MDSMKPLLVSRSDPLSPPLVVYGAERCIDILVGLGVDEAELEKHLEKSNE
jgi:hypothetical protein